MENGWFEDRKLVIPDRDRGLKLIFEAAEEGDVPSKVLIISRYKFPYVLYAPLIGLFVYGIKGVSMAIYRGKLARQYKKELEKK